jgi:hypothetical protein
MPTKNSKNVKKQTKPAASNPQLAAQIMFTVIALIVILSMVFSATANF